MLAIGPELRNAPVLDRRDHAAVRLADAAERDLFAGLRQRPIVSRYDRPAWLREASTREPAGAWPAPSARSCSLRPAPPPTRPPCTAGPRRGRGRTSSTSRPPTRPSSRTPACGGHPRSPSRAPRRIVAGGL